MSEHEVNEITLGGAAGARHWEKEIFDQGKKCSHCNTYQMRVNFYDGDILDVACLCGHRSYMDQDGYSDRVWTTENVYRLFLMDKNGQAEVHFFRDGYKRQSIRQQVAEFCKKHKADCPMLLPLDPIPGTDPTLVATALHMAETFYNAYETAVVLCHHYAGDDGSEAENQRYEQDMRDQDIDPYGHQTPEERQRIATESGFANYEAFLADFWARPKTSNDESAASH